MVRAIPFWKLQKTWAVILGNAIFVLIFYAQMIWIMLCGRLFSHFVKFSSFMFLHKISTRVVCVNGRHPVLAI